MTPKSTSPQRISVIGIGGIPEVTAGDPLAELFVAAAGAQGDAFADGDVLIVAQKVVSKSEDRFVELASITPSQRAKDFAAPSGKDARLVQLVFEQSKAVVKQDRERGILITETLHGFVCANAGIDTSNVAGDDTVLLLPEDPDASARALAADVKALTGIDRLGVVIADTFGRPWREGHTDVAIGVAGLRPILDYRGSRDASGKVLRVTEIAVADELAGAGELVMGKATAVPLAIVRGVAPELLTQPGAASALVRSKETDLFR
jgi:coenzyme F420-0:L-glutamate ligase / coenzyme F420-1:gamma-L-glutamate ligase